MTMRVIELFAVIVDQSENHKVDGYSVFGPYGTEPEADAVMDAVSNAAMEGQYEINKVIVAPMMTIDTSLVGPDVEYVVGMLKGEGL